MLVTKRDGSIRFCVDYRKLNSLSRKDIYPLPRINETLNTIGGAEWFCTMDLHSQYWQVNMEEADKPKTAFRTRKGLFQFKVMPFGMSNSPSTFQRLMDKVLRGLQWEKCLKYLDDIIVFGKTFPETLDNLRCVMQRLKAANLKLKASKCQWFRQSVKYLGHIVSKDGIACDPEKTEAIQSWPVPNTVTQVRQFIGFASYYRKFIPNFSEIAQPLTSLTKKSVRFSWSQDCQKAFDTLKEKLASPPVLAYPKDEGEYILDTDASNHAIRAVFSQFQDEEERVISFASRALCGGQKNYCTTKQKLLAVVTFVEHFRYFLYGQHYTIRSDHALLKWLRNFKNIDSLLARWLSKLEKYDYKIVHRKGPQHANADGLSRLPARKCPRNNCPQCTMKVYSITAQPQADETDEWLTGWSNQDLFDWQRQDPAMNRIIGWLETSSEYPKGVAQYDGQTHSYLAQWEALFLNEYGILCRKWYPQEKGLDDMMFNQIVAPKQIRKRILESFNIMGPLPQTNDGNLYIMVVGDYFNKWTEAYPLKNHTAQTVADVLVEQVVARFGVMRSLHSDQGPEFESNLTAELCKLLRTHKSRTVPYNPKSDGLAERANRTVVQMLTTLVSEARNDWDNHLPFVMMAYRASVHETTQFTPNGLMLNHETNLPIDLMIGSPPETPTCPVHLVEWVRSACEHAFEFVQRNLKVGAERQNRLYDRKSGFPKCRSGYSVWRFSPPKAKLKFGKPWEGLYLVTAKVNELFYRIQKTPTSRSIVVHVDHVKNWLKSDVSGDVSEDDEVEPEVGAKPTC